MSLQWRVWPVCALLLAAGRPEGGPPAGKVQAGAPPAGSWLREVEIKAEAGSKPGESHYTVRFTPDRTQRYDHLLFELPYHQEFPWVDARGRKSTKVHEPVSFKYEHKNVSFTADLDAYVSFRVPVGMDLLVRNYGETAFNREYPVTLPEVKISGIVQGAAAWCYVFPGEGKHKVAEIAAAQRAAAEKKKNVKKEDLSDLKDVPDWLK